MVQLLIEGKILTRQGIIYGQVEINEGVITSLKVEARGGADIKLNKNQLLSPILYDSHVHLRDLLQKERETIATGTEHLKRTGVVECNTMPNTNPVLDSAERLEHYLKIIEKDAKIKTNVYGLLRPGIESSELEKMTPYCNNKFKALQAESIGAGFFTDNDELISHLIMLPENAEIRIHFEDPKTLEKNKDKWNPEKPWTHIKVRPAEAEYKGLKYIIDNFISLRPDLKIVACHISSRKGIKLIEKTKKEHENFYCEVAYHYLYFYKKHYKTKGVKMKCNPSIKKKKDRKKLFKALKKGLIDYLISDHAPHTYEDKMNKYFSGVSSYNAGVFGYLVKKMKKKKHLGNLLKAATKEEYEIKKGNKARMMILNLKGRIVKPEHQKTKAAKVSPYNDECLPYVEKLIIND